MDLSVVVPTLNGRDRLATSLDTLAEHIPDAEIVVVNGPSADGTTGMVRDREDVDVLVEISARTLNVARNASIEAATGDAIAFVNYDLAVEPSWFEAVEGGFEAGDVVTGPTHRTLRAGMTTEEPERRTIADRDVTYFSGGNVAFRAAVLEALDGFDEYLETGGARDAAHRLANLDYEVEWRPGMSVRREYEADGGHELLSSRARQNFPASVDGITERNWRWKYRSLAYRLVKNYGVRPTIIRRAVQHAVGDAIDAGKGVVRGDVVPTAWFGTGRAVVAGTAVGVKDGLVARARDRSPTRNPYGCSWRTDRVVALYDWR